MRKLLILFLLLGTTVQGQMIGIVAGNQISAKDYGLTNISYSGLYYDGVSDITTVRHINYSNQGSPIVGSSTQYYQYNYTQSDPDDISTLSLGTGSFQFKNTAQGGFWMKDGNYYLAISNSTDIRYRPASTSYDITTLGSLTKLELSSAALGSMSETRGLAKGGDYYYILDQGTDEVKQYSFADMADPSSTITYHGKISIVNAGGNNYQGIEISPDGVTMIIANTSTDYFDEWELSTAWDVTTATYVQSYDADISGSSVQYVTLTYSPDGSYLIATSSNNGRIYQFNLNN